MSFYCSSTVSVFNLISLEDIPVTEKLLYLFGLVIL